MGEQLTNDEAADFWWRYFGSSPVDEVGLESFCDAVQAEYSLSVIKESLVGENVDTNQVL